MIQYIFTVFDSAAKAFLEPFFAPTTESALRSFRQVVNKEGHQFNQFPEDYTIFLIGTFDQQTGIITPENPTSLGVAITFIEGRPVVQPDAFTNGDTPNG
ncbi:putative nonstructural protein [Eel River basin pequenovirus]|nr:putative nonstructural protein [Eel River basin pequenovirus]